MENFKISTFDGKTLFATKYIVKDAIATVQISHGMAEHRERYKDFAEFLNSQKINVYINDHRGHGENIVKGGEIPGFFDKENGWNKVVSDMADLSEIAKKENPDKPFFIFGHSMGSFLSRTFYYKYPEIADGFIFCGTGALPEFLLKIAKKISINEGKKIGFDQPSPKLDKLSFGNFNKKFKNTGDTGFEWLSRDKEQVKKYLDDKLCGFICTPNLFKNMLEGNILVNSPKTIKACKKTTPILFISGEKDPVGGKKTISKLTKLYKKCGIKDVENRIYKDGRHELLNEINRKDVYQDIVSWIKEHI